MPPRRWLLRLEDILDAIDKIERYTRGLDGAGFVEDERTRDAVIWNFTVIGEAARSIPEEIEKRYPNVPWSRMRGMRNVIVHEYFGVDDVILWQTATRNLPPVAVQLREILEQEHAE